MRRLVVVALVISALVGGAAPALAGVNVDRGSKYVTLTKEGGKFPTGIYQPDRVVTLDLNGDGTQLPPGNGCPITTTDVLSGSIGGR